MTADQTKATNGMHLTRKDFVDKDGYLHYDSQLETDGDLIVEGDLGWLKFKFGIYVKGSIIIKAGSGIEAGDGIKAGDGIISLRSGLRAKFISCLRIAVGFHTKDEQLIESEIKKGDVILGKVTKPNPLPPVEYAWHVHHKVLFEALSEPIENRIEYIKENKPESEVEIRLRLIQKVQDQDGLKKAMRNNNHNAIQIIHKKECKDCPWDGRTIFPKGNKELE